MRFLQIPKKLTLAPYEEIRSAAKKKYQKTPGIVDLLEFGTIPYPGISDIDFITIVEPNHLITLPSFQEFSNEDIYPPFHRPFVFTPETFKKIRAIDPWFFQVKPILKEKHSFSLNDVDDLNNEKEHIWMSLRLIFHWSITFANLVTAAKAKKEISCHAFLDNAVALKYCYRELKRAGVTDVDDPHISYYCDLRDKWFSVSKNEQETLITEGIERLTESTEKLLTLLNAFAEKTSIWKTPIQELAPKTCEQRALLRTYPNSVIFNGPRRCYVFQKNCKEIAIRQENFSLPLLSCLGGRYTKTYIVLPLALSNIYNHYPLHTGPISDICKACCITDLPSLPFAPDAISHFISTTNTITNQTKSVFSGKYYFELFGWKPSHKKISWRLKIGKICEYIVQTLGRSSLSQYIGKKIYSKPLTSATLNTL